MSRLGVFIVLGLSIAFVPAFVNAAQLNASKRQTGKPNEPPLEKFIHKVLAEGYDNDLGPNLARVLGLDPNHKTKGSERFKDDCLDNRYRSVNVVVEKIPESDRLKPISVIFLAKKTQPGASDSNWFKLKPDGSIEKAFRGLGKLTDDGHGVPGSAVDVDLDPDEAKVLLKRELDFWLKGIGLKKKPVETAKKAAPEPTQKPEAPAKSGPK
ncbi:MAG: hypothetical protein HY924_08455 [Elusimicrobia bacterium]|nr:hypothetical protein [Elusimicrobiota bacterium]